MTEDDALKILAVALAFASVVIWTALASLFAWFVFGFWMWA